MLINVLSLYYLFIFIFVGLGASATIVASVDVFDFDKVLSSKKEFIRCVFMYQIALWKYLSDDINTTGMIILEIITTLSVWFINMIVLLGLITAMIIKGICKLFYLLFKKRVK